MTMRAVIERAEIKEEGSVFLLTAKDVGIIAVMPPAGKHFNYLKKNALIGRLVYVETDYVNGVHGIKVMEFLKDIAA